MTNRQIKGGVRRTMLITTYGVGAVIALKDESFMVAGIDAWPARIPPTPDLFEPRLQRLLRVRGFRLPPASDHAPDVPVVRFPLTYFCPGCGRLAPYGFFSGLGDGKCGKCSLLIVPSRFVVACPRGHIDDFPYFEWVHKGVGDPGAPGDDSRKVRHELSIRAGGASAALRDIELRCTCGVPPTTLHGAFGRDALRRVKRCTGRRPWLGDQEPCDELPRTLQRGASNVYFSVVRSALSIPPWSEGAMKLIDEWWPAFEYAPKAGWPQMVEGMDLTAGTAYSVADLVEVLRERKSGDAPDAPPIDEAAIRSQEYKALLNGREEVSADQDFVCVPAAGADEVAPLFDGVMVVMRLREVRALTGFTRLQPPTPSDPDHREAPLSVRPLTWLPAMEVQGEGVFFRVRLDRLTAWEQQPAVRERAARLDRRYKAKFTTHGVVPDRTITARHVLLHTLAHVLITQWSLASGYPAASLRERLYTAGDEAGFLIYTATSDSAGSLGGVVAEADAGRLRRAVQEAAERTAWCSADPICIEADAQGAASLNLAACHACVLLPEVCCEEGNGLLDRALLVGTPDQPALGFLPAAGEEV